MGQMVNPSRADAGAVASGNKRDRLRVSRDAVRGAEAGLLALFCVFLTFAMFGPGFAYWVGFGLLSAAAILALGGIRWAHRASHAVYRDPYVVSGGYATVGAATSWLAFVLAAGYLGLLFLLLHPIFLMVAFTVGTLAVAIHLERRLGEEDFRRTLDLAGGTAQCALCRRPVSLKEGRWRSYGWTCAACYADPWRASA